MGRVGCSVRVLWRAAYRATPVHNWPPVKSRTRATASSVTCSQAVSKKHLNNPIASSAVPSIGVKLERAQHNSPHSSPECDQVACDVQLVQGWHRPRQLPGVSLGRGCGCGCVCVWVRRWRVQLSGVPDRSGPGLGVGSGRPTLSPFLAPWPALPWHLPLRLPLPGTKPHAACCHMQCPGGTQAQCWNPHRASSAGRGGSPDSPRSRCRAPPASPTPACEFAAASAKSSPRQRAAPLRAACARCARKARLRSLPRHTPRSRCCIELAAPPEPKHQN